VNYVIAFIIVSWFPGLCAIFDVLLQPKVAFRAAGHSKRLWLAIEIVGFLLSYTGMITWLVYSIWIRTSVVRAGRPPTEEGARSLLASVEPWLSPARHRFESHTLCGRRRHL
jgi:hypothetical protein